MKFRIKQLDTTNTSPKGAEEVSKDINGLVEALEKDGYAIIGEDFMPQQNNVRSLLMVYYEKALSNIPKNPVRYSYLIMDSRNSYGVVEKIANERALQLEKDGKEIIRCRLVPMLNAMYTQLLITYRNLEPKQEVKKPA